MGCCNSQNNSDQKRSVRLEFIRTELEDDIAQIGYVSGDVSPSDGGDHSKHQKQDVIQSGNRDRVLRMLSLAYGEVLEMLYDTTTREVDEGEWDNELDEPERYVVDLAVPTTFSKTTVEYLRHAIHEYMICRVWEDWMSIVDPAQMEIWGAKCRQAKEDIMKSMAKRGKRLRLRLTPW
ncbi:hypothetical protein [Paramuribaculum intestinale]|uniref:hypothetical protein n=1 Tax=Paramuribaculum intestinale TaxID=2094151 RepID=UPI00272AEBBE|nr:hypothetical protein [Paramuribaculum intestinale]